MISAKVKSYLIIQTENKEERTPVIRGDNPAWHQTFTL